MAFPSKFSLFTQISFPDFSLELINLINLLLSQQLHLNALQAPQIHFILNHILYNPLCLMDFLFCIMLLLHQHSRIGNPTVIFVHASLFLREHIQPFTLAYIVYPSCECLLNMAPSLTPPHAKCHCSSIHSVFPLQRCVIHHLLIGLPDSLFYCVHTFIRQLSEAHEINFTLLSTPHKVFHSVVLIRMPSKDFIVWDQPIFTVSLPTTSFLFYPPL